MGNKLALGLAVYSLVLSGAAAVFCGWVLHVVHQCATAALGGGERKQQRQRSLSSGRNDVLCPCIFGRFNTVQFTMAITAASVTCALIACVVYCMEMAVFAYECDDCGKTNEWPPIIWPMQATTNAFLIICFALLFVTHFERLRLTFRATQHRLPKSAPNLLYVVTSFGLLLLAGTNVSAFALKKRILTAIFGVTGILWYFACVSALIGTFFKKTMAVANSAEKRDDKLTNTAVRVTVSATLSVLSTTAVYCLWFAAYVLWPKSIVSKLVGNSFVILDVSLNAFCLLCTFRGAKHYYYCAFAKVHAFVLRRVSGARALEQVVSVDLARMASVTVSADKSKSFV